MSPSESPKIYLLVLGSLVCSLLSLAVVAFGPTLVANKLRVHALGGAEALLLGALNTIAMRLERLVTGCVVLLFDHGLTGKADGKKVNGGDYLGQKSNSR